MPGVAAGPLRVPERVGIAVNRQDRALILALRVFAAERENLPPALGDAEVPVGSAISNLFNCDVPERDLGFVAAVHLEPEHAVQRKR